MKIQNQFIWPCHHEGKLFNFFQAVGDLIEISEKMEDEEEGMEGVEDKEWQEEE